MKQIKTFYRNRFNKSDYLIREKIWRVLCRNVFQKMIDKDAVLMDIGAGYCEFINNIDCKRKIAVDLNPDTKIRAGADVEVLNTSIMDLPNKLEGKIDVIFMSNFLEHLNSKKELMSVIEKSYSLLKKRGKLIILQPNIDLVKEKYWDFIDHSIPLNLSSLTEALEAVGFRNEVAVKRFLPYTTKNNLMPFIDYLMKLYLLLPSFLRPFAGQSLLVAAK